MQGNASLMERVPREKDYGGSTPPLAQFNELF